MTPRPVAHADPAALLPGACQLVDTTASPFARLHTVGLDQVDVRTGFWADRQKVNREVTLEAQYAQCVSSGALDNFRGAASGFPFEFRGRFYADSDVYKWVEAVAWELAQRPSALLQRRLNEVVDLIAGAQEPSGYLNTYFTGERSSLRWTNLTDLHEIYCGGHLIQAAVAVSRSTGDNALLVVACRWTDHVDELFGWDRLPGTDGHPGVELALVELYRATGEIRYLDLAGFSLDQRGRTPGVVGGDEYHLDHKPLRAQTEVVGHAVRALYLYAGAADVALETGDQQLIETLMALWEDLHAGKVYLTGGVGARWDGESVGAAYELPNDSAYAETCAAVAHIMLAWRLLLLTGDGRFRDAIETTLYNGALAGISLDGTRFFYQNPLADYGRHRRREWFETACCPPNLARMLASLPGLIYSTSPTEFWVHQLIESACILQISGAVVKVRLTTQLPWAGVTTLEMQLSAPAEFELVLPDPQWTDNPSVRVNDTEVTVARSSGYLRVTRRWHSGDRVDLVTPMAPRVIAAHPLVAADHGRLAVTRGPLVYCLEGVDNPDVNLSAVAIFADVEWSQSATDDELEAVMLEAEARYSPTALDAAPLYQRQPGGVGVPAQEVTVHVKAVPYFLWANRSAGAMSVWLAQAQHR